VKPFLKIACRHHRNRR